MLADAASRLRSLGDRSFRCITTLNNSFGTFAYEYLPLLFRTTIAPRSTRPNLLVLPPLPPRDAQPLNPDSGYIPDDGIDWF